MFAEIRKGQRAEGGGLNKSFEFKVWDVCCPVSGV
jgi:hypothetical protein